MRTSIIIISSFLLSSGLSAENEDYLTNSNPIRFSSTWSGFPDATTNQAEISNDTGTFETLMIIGNKSAGLGRRVSVWDRLEVNGSFHINGSSNRGMYFDSEVSSEPTEMNKIILWSDENETSQYGFGISNSQLNYRANNHVFYTTASNPVEAVRINTQGYVGIGTANPLERLQVEGSIRLSTSGKLFWDWPSRSISQYRYSNGSREIRFMNSMDSSNSLGGFNFTDNAGASVMKITDMKVGIGTVTPQNALDVNGTIRSKEIIVETNWSDFVFENDYKLRPLAEVSTFISEHGHLPDVPSAETVQSQGLSVGESQAIMMQKIEEMTLYIIQQEADKTEQQALIDQLISQNELLEQRLGKLEASL